MSMNATPSGERIHIGFFGKRNAGKSSLINAVTGQALSIVSEIKGTTTDPVKKAMELLPLGPVVVIDTPGLDDEGSLGEKRVGKAYEMLHKTDIVVLVIAQGDEDFLLEKALLEEARAQNRKVAVVINKIDLMPPENVDNYTTQVAHCLEVSTNEIWAVSAQENKGISEWKKGLAQIGMQEEDKPLVRDLLVEGDVVVLVVPIDDAAPKGRLILPQQQVIRDVLEAGGIPVVTKETQLQEALKKLTGTPRMVITDSQVFGKVAKIVPREVPLTSFSILMSRYKGDLKTQVKGAEAIENLQDGDKVLISEGCTHHRQCGDIGTQKMPKWIREYTKKELEFTFTSGGEFPKDLKNYALIVHCGGCMLNAKEMKYRMLQGKEQEIPFTNYGVMIAYIHGILARVIEPFYQELDD